jgi:methylglutaconyl-CoA hydratase
MASKKPNKYKTLLVESRNGIGIIWLNRPELRNAFNTEMVAELDAAFGAMEADDAVRAVVLAANGPAFCAGADLNTMKAMAGFSQAKNLEDARGYTSLWKRIDTLSKPVVARVHGAAIAGGTGLVAACDIAVASTDAVFALTETKIGLVPATVGPYVLRAIGMRSARRYFLTGERFDAAEAYRIGLVQELCPPAELDHVVNALLGELVQCSPAALAACKDLLSAIAEGSQGTPGDAVSEDTARRIAAIRVSPEGKEGIRAFLEKRRPAWHPEARSKPKANPRPKVKRKA